MAELSNPDSAPATAATRTRIAARLTSLRNRVREFGLALSGLWRRSLQLRVVALTLAITSAVVAVVGYVLVTQISSQLIDVKTKAAINQSSYGVSYINEQFDLQGAIVGQDLNDVLEDSVGLLQTRSTSAGEFYVMAVVRDTEGTVVRTIASETSPVTATDLPDDLQQRAAEGLQGWSYARMLIDGSEQSVLVVGSAVPTDRGDYELYYVYPLTTEISVTNFVTQTVIAAAIAFLILIPGIGMLVSRLVVLPVRSASRTSQRLAGGDLSQRMEVRGEDDLAKLAMSFNGMAASLSSQINRLERLSLVQQRFSSDVSHELRTPLTTVRMAAELLHDYRDEFPEAAARSAELLHTELDRFEALLKDLLEISRYDAGGMELDADEENVEQLVDRIVTTYRPLAAEQGSEIQVEAIGEVPPAEISVRRLERVLRNLVANALEHGEGKPVEVTLAGDATTLAISVRDHGVGIDQNAADRLFDRFWRADPSRVRKLGGTGLGMAISLEDVLLHNGWLHVWGKPGHGCNFRVTVPLVAGATIDHSPLPLVPVGEQEGYVGGSPHIELAPPEPRAGEDLT
ncbi:HAMP domain-containing protein [Epidermidibacterium keratini]|uniref:Sensor histidine kinase MtrB n=1 Tax=Epidermidibacterium keratini TaxID=1891644 RepID=A0A7L4YR72_9ACTN|nr:MtrAB system histidine kinase MtrB [Epidermidibacterium keratini]QHC01562.1 HAMP domain-containing protein [Epidermidibacterium keratini]